MKSKLLGTIEIQLKFDNQFETAIITWKADEVFRSINCLNYLRFFFIQVNIDNYSVTFLCTVSYIL